MAALISWVCRIDHAVKTGDEVLTTVTIHRGQWAYCSQGDRGDCIWEAVQPTPIQELHPVRRPSEASAGQQVSQGAE